MVWSFWTELTVLILRLHKKRTSIFPFPVIPLNLVPRFSINTMPTFHYGRQGVDGLHMT